MIQLKDYLWVSNHEINKEAGAGLQDFLEKIDCIEALRERWTFEFSFYPTNKKEYDINLRLWDYINKDRNSLNDSRKVFGLGFPPALYNFLRYTKRTKVMSAVALGLAGIFAIDQKKREILEKQVYPLVLNKAMKMVDKYFKYFIAEDTIYKDHGKNEVGYHRRNWQKFRDTFDLAVREEVGNSIVFPFINPLRSKSLSNFALEHKHGYDISVLSSYLTNEDWKRIVDEGIFDNMDRSESNPKRLVEWREDLSKYHKVYQLNEND